MAGQLSFGVLGPLSVEHQGVPVRLGSPKQRVLLAMLLLNANRPVAVDRLIDGIWGEELPDGAVNAVQAHVSHLRRALQVGDTAGAEGAALLTQPPGYLLRVSPEQLDLMRFEQLVRSGSERARAGQRVEAADELGRALSLWRGAPLEDLGAGAFADSARVFLEERRLAVVDDRLELLLGLGRDGEVVAVCEEVLRTSPLRESVWERLILALYRSGRQADALARYRRCREVLLDELGVEPMPRLQVLERQILNQDERLQRAPRSTGTQVVQVGGGRNATGAPTVVRPRRLDAQLVLPDGGTLTLGDRTLLGRHPDCDLVLDDAAVSRRHAEIRLANGSHVLLDLSSANGTWVAGEPVLQHLLRDGDRFQVGDQVLHYRIG